jgi:lysozyme
MANLNKLVDMLVQHEGMREKPYEDTTGHLTIGVGRNLDSIGLSHDEIYYMLKNDIRRCEEELTNAFRWFKYLDDVRQHAMINLCFNLGITRLRKFKKALAAMETDDFEEAADEFLDSKWAQQVGSRAMDVTYLIRFGKYYA